MTGPGLLAGAGTALLLGGTAAGLVPRLTTGWIPHHLSGWPWPARLSVGAATTGLAGLLIWQHHPTQPTELLLLAAWLTFATAGTVLSAIDIVVRRLPSPIITTTAATIVLLLATGAVLRVAVGPPLRGWPRHVVGSAVRTTGNCRPRSDGAGPDVCQRWPHHRAGRPDV